MTVALRANGVSLVLQDEPNQLPEIVHFGPDLGVEGAGGVEALMKASTPPVPRSAFDKPVALRLLPLEVDGWSGRPGLAAHRSGAAFSPSWSDVQVHQVDAQTASIEATDESFGLGLNTEVRLDDAGILIINHHVTNLADGVIDLAGLMSVVPIPPTASEVLDLTGRWCGERRIQRSDLQMGGRIRESRRGRSGHDSAFVMVAGEPGFTERHGEVFATHVAWSGDHLHMVDRLPEGAGRHAGILGGGELIRPGEVRLETDETYSAPPVLFAWSDRGLDGLSDRFHQHLRARTNHPPTVRPVTLNTWEAIYFDHDMERLGPIIDAAAEIGVERIVLDDGWFTGRRDDTAGLGDWAVDAEVWPHGLAPYAERVRSHGMQVGLWVEPEMVNLDSDLAREHPDWVFAAPERTSTKEWRFQQVLDLSNPDAFEHVLSHLDTVLTNCEIDYLKWDHNRDLIEALDVDGQPAVRRQTLATYALMDELVARHPGLEIESCASGGGRVDLGILEHTVRVWASDSNDPLERQSIQRWTGLLLPPELVGTHVGPTTSHTSGRVTDLDFRCLTALWGHAGIEWDITKISDEERSRLASWISLHKRLRPLLHTGRTIRGPELDGAWLHGVVSHDQTHGAFSYVRLVSGADAMPGLVRLHGLDPKRTYAVRALDVTGRDEVRIAGQAAATPPWTRHGVTLSGDALMRRGLAMPVLDPMAGLLFEVSATDHEGR